MTVAQLFEGSSPLAQKLQAAGPHESPAAMIARARDLIETLTDEERIATLDAHPRIGERGDRLSSASLREQGGDILEVLDDLNDRYERRFGFRFVVFVNRRSKAQIVDVLRSRLENDRDQELATGLSAVVDIAEDRLRQQ